MKMLRRGFLAASCTCLLVFAIAGCNTEQKSGITVELTFYEPSEESDDGLKQAGEKMVIENAKVGDVYKTMLRGVDIDDRDKEWPIEVRFQDVTPEAAMFDFVILYVTSDGMPYNFSRTTTVEIGVPDKFKHNGNDFFEGNGRMGFEVLVTQE